VRSLGISEATVDDLERAARIHPVAAVQSELSLWTGLPSRPSFRGARARRGLVAFAARPGFLAGAVSPDARFGSTISVEARVRSRRRRGNQRIVESVRAVAARGAVCRPRRSRSRGLARGEHVVAIPGTQKIKHVEDNVAAADLDLTAAELALLDAIPARSEAVQRDRGTTPLTLPAARSGSEALPRPR
jgi:aryl-alcohol dehydrogenase-like predicted oxidoreductase